jgi:hypothetical protein
MSSSQAVRAVSYAISSANDSSLRHAAHPLQPCQSTAGRFGGGEIRHAPVRVGVTTIGRSVGHVGFGCEQAASSSESISAAREDQWLSGEGIGGPFCRASKHGFQLLHPLLARGAQRVGGVGGELGAEGLAVADREGAHGVDGRVTGVQRAAGEVDEGGAEQERQGGEGDGEGGDHSRECSAAH